MRVILLILFLISTVYTSLGQEINKLSFSEYLGYIKKYHPIVKQAQLVLSESEAKLLKARGAFDPVIDINLNDKNFQETEYYSKFNAAFKIPTWYGISLKGGFEDNTGTYLNPEQKVPEGGLYNAGISISLAKGLLMNQRMAALKKAKIYNNQALVEKQLAVTEVLYTGAIAYFNWHKAYQEKKVYKTFLDNAKQRLEGVRKSYQLGEKPAIDTTEARIAYNNRKLSLEKASLTFTKATLELSNFIWINEFPVELNDTMYPDEKTAIEIDNALQLEALSNQETNPKLKLLDYKQNSLEIENKLKKNNLLPTIDFQYNFLSEDISNSAAFTTANYKLGFQIKMPLFLRKERAELKLSNYKLQAIAFEKQAISVSINNKITSIQQEISSIQNQIALTDLIVKDYNTLLKGEQRKFDIGESSLFLINSREVKLIENKLKYIAIENQLLEAKGKLFHVLGGI